MAARQEGRAEHGTRASPAALRRRPGAVHRHGARRFLARRQPVHARAGDSAARRSEQRPGRSLRCRPRPQSAGGFWASLRQTAGKSGPGEPGSEKLFKPGRGGFGPGRQDHFGAAGPVCRDDEGEIVDFRNLEGSRRHRRGRRHVSRGDVQRGFRASRTPLSSEGRPRSPPGALARIGDRHQGTHAVPCGIAAGVRIWQPSEGVRGPAPYPRRGNTPHHAHRSGRQRRGLRFRNSGWRQILSVDPRLPGAVAAGLADPQAKRNPSRPG